MKKIIGEAMMKSRTEQVCLMCKMNFTRTGMMLETCLKVHSTGLSIQPPSLPRQSFPDNYIL